MRRTAALAILRFSAVSPRVRVGATNKLRLVAPNPSRAGDVGNSALRAYTPRRSGSFRTEAVVVTRSARQRLALGIRGLVPVRNIALHLSE